MFVRTCTFDGCSNKHRAHGLCSSHLDQLARGKELTPLLGPHGRRYEHCTFPDCTRKHQSGGLCTGHATQRQRGQPLRRLRGDGRWVDPKGYVCIRCPDPDHPNAKSKGGWVAEHVWVMSQVLGRPLPRGESVHHRNNIKHDNRPDNLELWHTHQPKGAGVEDTVRWARWFLAQYGEEFPEATSEGSEVTGGHSVDRFPEIEPLARGMLDVGDGQRIYWEASGNAGGRAAVCLHGGPGSGSAPGRRRLFDPEAYLIVQFDQRGCGRSTPHAGDPATDLSVNTTHHLIDDMERLREHLGVERWLLWGGSWGVTLALAYAERHPERVSALVLASVTMTRPGDVHWLYHEVGRYFPEQWERFRNGVPEAERDGDLVAAYHRLLNGSADVSVRERAARDWCRWEDELLSNEEGWRPNPRYDDPAFRMAFARIVTHYFHHHAWLEDGQLLRDAGRLAGIPGVLIHGRFDLGGPADTAWQLARAWPTAELHLVATGHAGGEEMTARTLEATNRLARLDR